MKTIKWWLRKWQLELYMKYVSYRARITQNAEEYLKWNDEWNNYYIEHCAHTDSDAYIYDSDKGC